MAFLKQLKHRFFPEPDTSKAVPVYTELHAIKREFVDFGKAYRIGILAYYSGPDEQKIISDYQRKLETLGYECDVLLFFDKKEHDIHLMLPHFDTTALDKKNGLPNAPKTDLFRVKKFDLLLNLYLTPILPLTHIAENSHARCRVGPHLKELMHVSDVMVHAQTGDSLTTIIDAINATLNLKPYVRN